MFASKFMFATGIENSYPTILLPNGQVKRVDELEKTNHYNLWKRDFELTQEMGIEFLRYGPPYYKTHLGPDKYDWEFSDLTFTALRDMGITPIVDLCHFGVPDWIGGFANPDFPRLFADYARGLGRPGPTRQPVVLPSSYPTSPVSGVDAPLVALLGRQRGPLLELPVGPRGVSPTPHAQAMYRSIFHWRPLLNGYSGYYPRDYVLTMGRMMSFPDEGSMARLRAHHVRYIVVHKAFYTPEEYTRVLLRIASRPDIRPWGTYQDVLDDAVLFVLER